MLEGQKQSLKPKQGDGGAGGRSPVRTTMESWSILEETVTFQKYEPMTTIIHG